MKLSRLLLLAALAPHMVSAEQLPQRMDVTRDLQEFFLIDFDPAPFKRKRVVRAESLAPRRR